MQTGDKNGKKKLSDEVVYAFITEKKRTVRKWQRYKLKERREKKETESKKFNVTNDVIRYHKSAENLYLVEQ